MVQIKKKVQKSWHVRLYTVNLLLIPTKKNNYYIKKVSKKIKNLL